MALDQACFMIILYDNIVLIYAFILLSHSFQNNFYNNNLFIEITCLKSNFYYLFINSTNRVQKKTLLSKT